LNQIPGSMPRLNAIPAGCAYHPRCAQQWQHCRSERPELVDAGATRAACWLHAVDGKAQHGAESPIVPEGSA